VITIDGKKNQTIAETTQQRTESVRQWITSPEGQDAIAACLQRAQSLTAQYREAQRIDPESLYKPITL
jgi:hypothetical protein